MLRRTVRNPSFRRLTSSLRAGLGLFHNKNSSVPKDTSTSHISIYLLDAWCKIYLVYKNDYELTSQELRKLPGTNKLPVM